MTKQSASHLDYLAETMAIMGKEGILLVTHGEILAVYAAKDARKRLGHG
jgi:hypothetical protein